MFIASGAQPGQARTATPFRFAPQRTGPACGTSSACWANRSPSTRNTPTIVKRHRSQLPVIHPRNNSGAAVAAAAGAAAVVAADAVAAVDAAEVAEVDAHKVISPATKAENAATA